MIPASPRVLTEKGGEWDTDLGPIRIRGSFDSGNFLRAELIHPVKDEGKEKGTYLFENLDYEMNIWTRPDCYGTPFENGNRTWFHFGVGGTPETKRGGVLKVNVVNLNKQTKLFLQGMQPVFRIIPERPKWDRVSDRVVINENRPSNENGCSISFRIRLPEYPEKSVLYLAFTYPLGYLESCSFLNQLSTISPSLPKSGRNYRGVGGGNNDIYYHRECVCYSLEGRRVELITVSSVHGISTKREVRLSNLFPILEEDRPFKFPGKKVVFLSARVHPGETPSSFVLNGFLKFIMNQTDPRAVILRRLFVFKFIPILNPDGVYNGHYRTDPRGVNLNRVYLCPSRKDHPSIYAARKLLIYYHSGVDEEGLEDENECSVLSSATSSSNASLNVVFDEDTCLDNVLESKRRSEAGECSRTTEETSSTKSNVKKPYTFVLSHTNSLCAGCVPLLDPLCEHDKSSQGDKCGSCGGTQGPAPPGGLDTSFGGSSHQCAFEACDEDSVLYENLKVQNEEKMDVDGEHKALVSVSEESVTRAASPRRKKKPATPKKEKKRRSQSVNATKEKSFLANTGSPSLEDHPGTFNFLSTSTSKHRDSAVSASRSLGSNSRVTRSQHKSGNTSTSRYFDSGSGLFLYVDMHGHTTKRGIFMYGNHFPDVQTQAECMLVPRLMAINSPHFDFAACNFTERLMCVKDKKDGMSREGSGRVACLKLTGLVRSYTLECNYNTGRLVNPVVSRTSSGFVDTQSAPIFSPPNYTIELFEEVGKALAETVLDMSGQNPYSRLSLTEFKTVEGLKRALTSRLKLSPEFKLSGSDTSLKGSNSGGILDIGNNNVLTEKGPASKKLKEKALNHPGPLAPKNLILAPSGSQKKNVPSSARSSKAAEGKADGPEAGSSSGTAAPVKAKLAKVMKKSTASAGFPKFSGPNSGKKVKRKKKKSQSESTSSSEALPLPK